MNPFAPIRRLFAGAGKTDTVGEHWDNVAEWRPIIGGQQTKWQEFDDVFGPYTPAVAEAAHELHPVVARCVSLIGDTAPEPRLEVGFWHGDKWTPVEHHPVLELLANPAPFISANNLMCHLASNRILTGYGYALKIRNRSRSQIVQIWTLPPVKGSTPHGRGSASGGKQASLTPPTS